MSKKPAPQTTDERLDLIIEYMRRMDRRDKMRSVGGFINSLIRLIPLAIFVWSTWYFYQNGDDIMRNLTKQAAQQAAQMAGEQAKSITDSIDPSEMKKYVDSMLKSE